MPSLSQLILIILTNLNNFNKIAFWVNIIHRSYLKYPQISHSDLYSYFYIKLDM